MASAPFLTRLTLREGAELDPRRFPGSLPFLRDFELEFEAPVTFLVGENGSGKSTVLEAIAALSGLPVGGGGRNELGSTHAPGSQSELAAHLRAGFKRRPREGYFFRAEFQAHFASLLDSRARDPDFEANAYARYGGRSLHTRSHGEAFLAMFETWLSPGLILMDEPEAALSPQRQLALLGHMARLLRKDSAQFIIATHSPIFLTFPGARLLSFDSVPLRWITAAETSHCQITRSVLGNPERFWSQLLALEARKQR
ncbi:MAG: AAA family ATPase [Myxococcales bacterium]|nr:AAA family ATPase [Myxococcales bacterium]